ncbi:MAG: hypothetical protein AAGA15_05115 [Pseudomonadota bacterium]
MGRLLKLIIYMIVLAGIGLVAYAYVGPIVGVDFMPPRETVTVPVELDL